jgi:exodeoxyribonuclease VII large subunit
MPDPIPSNTPELTVGELASALKRTVEDRFGYVRVRGEISGYRGPHSSGHVYFSLKDQNARLDAVIWKMAFNRMKVRPEEGLEVIATGKLTTFPGKSSYQIIIDTIEPAGVGALMALLEERRRKLAAEGLFDAGRKRPIPFLPEVIGVVTSPTGAVIRDILHRLSDRFPRNVLVWPVRVQGETSGAEVAAAIAGLNALPVTGPIRRPSVIIVARGGGSLEDLWGFNDEAVVRAVAASAIPVVSAVGHETDWTLIDHVADLRAPTPTGAAEMCVPVRSDLLMQIADLGRRHHACTRRLLERRTADLRAVSRALLNGEDVVAVPRQRLDRAAERLASRASAGLRDRQLRLGRAAGLLARHSPQAEVARRRERFESAARRLPRVRDLARQRKADLLATAARRLGTAMVARTEMARHQNVVRQERLALFARRLRPALLSMLARSDARLQGSAKLLASLGYKNVLARGFALVLDSKAQPVRAARGLVAGAELTLRFADGQVGAQVTGGGVLPTTGEAPAAAARPARPKPTKPAAREQGSLF